MTQLSLSLYGSFELFLFHLCHCQTAFAASREFDHSPRLFRTVLVLASRWLIPMPAGINHACMRAPVPSPLHFGCFQLPAQNCTYSAGSIKIVRTYSTPVTVLYSAWRDGCTLASVHAWWEYLLFQPEKSFREQGVQEIRDCRFLVRRRHDDGIKTYS